ncbi:ABC transporter substrate-binding protein [Arthrobacter sp. MMS18-M83]|uniref:ABC transporter substrate-binding protein n=1 Tax=Arthrobacter sp. MMS18-M83 TaxID=2996261 RepID=UPI00227ABBB5|nr:ABC transporter substrate-binding protein [Arthrobacter sp. MMS18-M83]WAH96262.1 ABC transporter substrate-binding protein [Arthrobacter sp. MMS18-M83]
MKQHTSLRLRRATAALAALAASALALSGCGGSAGSPGGTSGAGSGQVLTVSNTFAPISMDPALSGNGRAGTMLQPAYEPLVRTGADGKLEPALAESWNVAPDNMSVTFKLRDNAKFSDGEPVTAEAAKKSIEYWVSKKGPFAVNLATLESVTVNGEFEFTVKVSAPNPDLASIFNTYWLAGDLISPKALATPDVLGTETHGAGPYVLDTGATITGKSYTYLPNKNYYDPTKIHWDKVVISVYEDQNSAVQAFKAGQLKVMVSDPITANANKAGLAQGARIVSDPVQWTGLIINDRTGEVNKPLGDVKVRQAINYGIDRSLVTQALFGDFGTPTSQLQVKGFTGYDETNDKKYPYDPEKAKALLAEAGYPGGITIDVGYVKNTLNSTQAQAIAGQLEKIGVKLNITEVQNFGELNTRMAQKKFGAIIAQSNSGTPFMAKFQTLDPNGSYNYYHSQDPELTALINAAAAKPAADSEEAWKKVQGRVADLAWFAMTSALNVSYFVAQGVDVPQPGQSLIIDMALVKPAT